MLCCLEFLKDDTFFSLSVDFDQHLYEHFIRIIISCILVLISFIIWISLEFIVKGARKLHLIMFGLYFLFLLMNLISNHFIKKTIKKYMHLVKSN